jgi:hypothetical protein
VCLIIDNCLAHILTDRNCSPTFLPIREAVFELGTARIVYGGQLRREYEKNNKLKKLLISLDRAGRADKISDKDVDLVTQNLLRAGRCKSNDHHIIALAKVSGTRLLCTDDKDLQKDFRDPTLISSPRGNVYTSKKHKRLILKHCSH